MRGQRRIHRERKKYSKKNGIFYFILKKSLWAWANPLTPILGVCGAGLWNHNKPANSKFRNVSSFQESFSSVSAVFLEEKFFLHIGVDFFSSHHGGRSGNGCAGAGLTGRILCGNRSGWSAAIVHLPSERYAYLNQSSCSWCGNDPKIARRSTAIVGG